MWVEADAEVLVNTINKNRLVLSFLEAILEEMKSLMLLINASSFDFVSRSVNQVAHNLAS